MYELILNSYEKINKLLPYVGLIEDVEKFERKLSLTLKDI